MKIRWMIAPATALLGLTLALTACGGDDDNTTSSTASATAVATDTSDATTTQKATATGRKTSTPKATATPEETSPDFSTPDIIECDLVKPDDLAFLANDTFDNGSQVGDFCTFTGVDGTIVSIETYDLGDNAREPFEAIAVTFGDEILDDPGDEAYYDTDLGLSILQGSIELDIYVEDPNGNDNRASAFAVSDFALPNLP